MTSFFVDSSEISSGADLTPIRARFRAILDAIAEGARDRDESRELPRDGIRALAEAGFGALRVPKKYGGYGVSLPQLVELLADLAAADPNLPQALRGHFALVEDRLNAHAASDQSTWFRRFVNGELAGNAWTEIGEVKVGDVNTKVSAGPDGLVVNGTKYYSTGSIFADWLDVYAQRLDTGETVIAIVNTHQSGVTLLDDWDGFGQRTTGSGTTVLENARVDAEAVSAFADRFRYQTAFYQVVLLATLAGIAENAVTEFAGEAQRRKRVFSHGASPEWNQDPLVQSVVGIAGSQAFAARATAVRAAEASQDAYLGHFVADADAEEEANIRAELDSARGQVVITSLAQSATSALFDALGASGTSAAKRLDRHWRNARTVSSHNPVVFKQRIIGDWEINQTVPPYVWAIGAAVQVAAAAS
ncbi:monooxygenase [Microbacterium sp. CH12i]|uniref:acyl-CoA dehydrogenase family protein n=1 Tax=Microbacterium sp. CH12i TaxID=1479651 RepID=UPI0004615A4F|nr:acyl-CoA dehydrogenase family protein [Microbacterium sp. CH12i]KDA05110.1 monooxygenase [Microbacterium sp. CH12i]